METTTLTPKQRRRQAAQRRRTHNVILAIVFLLILLLFFIINLFTGTKTFSDAENRNLAQMPDFSLTALADGSYFSNLTDYYNDQFFARDGWISMRLWVDRRLGRTESSTVFLCENDYLMSAPETPDEAAVSNTIAAMNNFADKHSDLNIDVMLVPDAATILSEYLPKNAPVCDQLVDIDNFIQQLNDSIDCLDVASALSAHADEYIFYRTDHHWTSLGAKYAFEAAAADLGIDAPVSGYDVYTVSDSFEGTLSSKSGSHKAQDTIEIYIPQGGDMAYYVTYPSLEKISSLYRRECLDTKDQYTVFFGGNHSQLEIVTTANNDRNLLVFKDSYANCFIQFLIPYYEKIIMVDPRYYYDSIETVITNQKITDVLYLYSADTLLKDTTLTDVLSSGSTSES